MIQYPETQARKEMIPLPYLPKYQKNEYTLVLDLDETLLHYDEIENNILIRPGADLFLKSMSEHFEIVIFTAGTKKYADWALTFLVHSECISHRLYRHHTLPFNNFYIKDLSRLGRNINKTIIVDNIPDNFILQPMNGIQINTWVSDQNDKCLLYLAQLLNLVIENKVKDVAEFLKVQRIQNKQLIDLITLGQPQFDIQFINSNFDVESLFSECINLKNQNNYQQKSQKELTPNIGHSNIIYKSFERQLEESEFLRLSYKNKEERIEFNIDEIEQIQCKKQKNEIYEHNEIVPYLNEIYTIQETVNEEGSSLQIKKQSAFNISSSNKKATSKSTSQKNKICSVKIGCINLNDPPSISPFTDQQKPNSSSQLQFRIFDFDITNKALI